MSTRSVNSIAGFPVQGLAPKSATALEGLAGPVPCSRSRFTQGPGPHKKYSGTFHTARSSRAAYHAACQLHAWRFLAILTVLRSSALRRWRSGLEENNSRHGFDSQNLKKRHFQLRRRACRLVLLGELSGFHFHQSGSRKNGLHRCGLRVSLALYEPSYDSACAPKLP